MLKILPLFLFLACHSMDERRQMTDVKTQNKFLALGDSYTIGESVPTYERWPVQLQKKLNDTGFDFSDPEIIATTGWTTNDLKQAIEKAKPDKDYELVSLLIGVNNQYQGKLLADYEVEFEELLKMSINFAGGDKNKVLVVSIPDYGFTPFGKSNQETISMELDKFNAVNKSIAAKYEVQYFNITDISRKGLAEPDLVATDGLHPSGKMYALWVERILQNLTLTK